MPTIEFGDYWRTLGWKEQNRENNEPSKDRRLHAVGNGRMKKQRDNDSHDNHRARKKVKLLEDTRRATQQQLLVGLFDVPDEVRFGILEYFSEADFSTYAACSRECYQDCMRADMPLAATTATVSPVQTTLFYGGGIEILLRKLTNGARRGVFRRGSRLQHIKLIHHGGHAKTRHSFARQYLKGVVLPSVTSLDMSLSPTCNKTERTVASCLPRFLAPMLPNLMQVDFSHTHLAPSALSDACKYCPKLQKVTTNGGIDTSFLTGRDFKDGTNLKEICMDDTRFWFVPPFLDLTWDDEDAFHNEFMELADSKSKVLCFIAARLEKVSLVNATFYGMESRTSPKSMTQIGLMKFVRHAPKLRWFRSNLTAENVNILKRERPDVEFVSIAT